MTTVCSATVRRYASGLPSSPARAGVIRSRMRLAPEAYGSSGRPVAAPTVVRSQRATPAAPGPASISVSSPRTNGRPPAPPTLDGAGISEVTSVLNRSAQPRDQASLYEYEEHQHRNRHHRRRGHDPAPVRLVRLVEDQQGHRQRRLRSVADDERLGEEEIVPGRDEREHTRGHQAGEDEGEENLPQESRAARPVDVRGLLQSLRHGLHEPPQHPDRE